MTTTALPIIISLRFGKTAWACSSVGRAFGSHPRGRGFESLQVHHEKRLAFASRFSVIFAFGELYASLKRDIAFGSDMSSGVLNLKTKIRAVKFALRKSGFAALSFQKPVAES